MILYVLTSGLTDVVECERGRRLLPKCKGSFIRFVLFRVVQIMEDTREVLR